MESDYDKQQWQAEQAVYDVAVKKQRDKERKARERSARNARRKLERLRRTLSETGEISDFETEFSDSVTQRLDQFGSAFNDLEKGRPGDALSFAQKRVVAGMNRKVKAVKKKRVTASDDVLDPLQRPRPSERKTASSFKRKGSNYTPRVRQLDETFEDEVPQDPTRPSRPDVLIPECEDTVSPPPVGRPFLRIVPKQSS